MQLFFNEFVDENSTEIAFDKEESKHIVKVLRKRLGDVLLVTNGKGVLFEAQIQSDNEKKCVARILKNTFQPKRPYYLHMVVAPTKMNERYEWFLEKATEIGVDEITPIVCEHSERTIVKIERFEKVVLSAMKQSLQCHKPIVNQSITFSEFIKKEIQGQKLIAYCQDKRQDLATELLDSEHKIITILIGPEGDFSLSEIKKAFEKGFVPISLGETRLRTETAALVACHSVSVIDMLKKEKME